MFTKQQIEEIASKLKLMSKKDSSFGTINDIMDNDEFPILPCILYPLILP